MPFGEVRFGEMGFGKVPLGKISGQATAIYMKIRKAFIPISQAFLPSFMPLSSTRLRIDPVAAPNTHMMARRSLSMPRKSIGLHRVETPLFKTYSLVSAYSIEQEGQGTRCRHIIDLIIHALSWFMQQNMVGSSSRLYCIFAKATDSCFFI